MDEKVQGLTAFRREAVNVAAQQSVQNSDEADRRRKVWLVLETAHDNWHYPSPKNVSLLRVLGEDACMVCEDRFDELETKGLWQAGETKMFRPLILRQEAEVIEYLKG